MRRTAPLVIVIALLVGSTAAAAVSPEQVRSGPLDPALNQVFSAPQVPEGFDVSLVGHTPGPVTGVAFSPDGVLYVTVIDQTEMTAAVTGEAPPANVPGGIYRFHEGPTGQGVFEPVLLGARVPLGLTFGEDGTLYYTDIVHGPLFGDSWGAVLAIDPDGGPTQAPRTVLQDLPVGVHQTNQVAFGPDGLLYVANGSSTDSGYHDVPSEPAPGLPIELAQPPERFPLTGSVLRFDPADALDAPLSATRYRGNGFIEDPLDVVATGIRNNYGLEFRGDDLYITFNGPNPMHGNRGDDLLLLVTDATERSYAEGTMVDFGWPGCLYRTDELGFPVGEAPDRVLDWFKPCGDPTTTPPIASMGPHASANGLALAPEGFGEHGGDLFVALYSAGRQVTRVELAEDGSVAVGDDGRQLIEPFAQGAGIIDAIFHEGDLYIARFASHSLFGYGTVWRISPSS